MTTCGWRYYLHRISGEPVQPSVAAVAGKAVHAWTEAYDHGAIEKPDNPAEWEEILSREIESEEDHTGVGRHEWRVSGRRTKTMPEGETVDAWLFLGAEMTRQYAHWRESSPLTIVEDLPPSISGTVGIEYKLDLDRWPIEPFVAYIDRVMTHPKHGVGVLDIKTGQLRSTPQLGFYAAGLRMIGVEPTWGAYYSTRTGRMKVYGLTHWTPAKAHLVSEPAQQAKISERFSPAPGEHCAWCPVRHSCQFAMKPLDAASFE